MYSRKHIVLAVFPCAFVLCSGESVTATIGIYHWGGTFTRSMHEGVEQIAALGVRNARITLSPRFFGDYNTGSGCYPQFSLTRAAQQPDIKQALDNPNIDLFMVTAYDGVSFGDCLHHRYLSPSFYTLENTAAIMQEYSDFTLYLYQIYRQTQKRFILANWEGDNDVYCGQAYAYASDQAFRSACDAAYSSIYDGNASSNDSFRALMLWLQARQAGITEGRIRAAALGSGGMRVYYAVEFSIVHALRNAGLKSVLHDILPSLTFDYASYSAYESINSTEPGKTLASDLKLIHGILGATPIILGEIGFSRSQWGSDVVVARSDEVIRAAAENGVSVIFQWNLYDQSTLDRFGLYDREGKITPLGLYYSALFKRPVSANIRSDE